MLRLRRYRVLLVCAFVITVLLYQVSRNSQWDPSQEIWRGKADTHSDPRPKPPSPPPPSTHEHEQGHEPKHHGDNQPQKPPYQAPPPPSAADAHPDPEDRPARVEEPTIKIPQLKTTDGVGGEYSLPTALPAVPDRKPPSKYDEEQLRGGDTGMQIVNPPAKHQADAVPTPTTAVHWQKPREWFPVPPQSVIRLPTGKPRPVPSVQFAFGEEAPAAKEKREQRLAKVKAEAQRAWSGYKKYAWTHDELRPVSKKSKDPFCGWAATLVDSLDTLWIMGLKEEFDDAVGAVKDIDFTTSPYRDDIPVFETVIRYLGGFLGAYDVAGGHGSKYRVLLDKAVELADILMSAFDTPNRMPVLYYNWKPEYNVNPKRASTHAGVAELGTLSMEFTRLAQLTGEHKYYDAIARITDALEDLQNRENATAISGIFPENLDASGCNRSATPPSTIENSSDAAREQAGGGAELAQSAGTGPGSNTGFHRGPEKRDHNLDSDSGPVDAKGLPANWDCVPQGLVGAGWGGGSYSMGGSQDSAYEYFPKQYLLLGGLEPKYRTMHEKVADAVKEYLLFRPMAEGDPDILFSAKATSSDGTAGKLSYEWEVTHLTCFLGGMFGLGGKIFDRPEDVEVGKKLADGCVWAYDVMPTGIMPEYAHVLPCKKADDCRWDESAWHAALDPNRESRESQLEEYYVQKEEWRQRVEELQKQHALRKKAEEQKRQEAADRKRLETQEAAATQGDRQSADASHSPEGSDAKHQKRDASDDGSTRELHAADPEKVKKLQDSLDLSPNGAGQRDASGGQDDQKPMDDSELVIPPAPVKPLSHQEYVTQSIKDERLPPGFVNLNDKRYILRPEAIESVWYMYRITGDPAWQDKGWRMFEAVVRATQTEVGHSAIRDVAAAGKTHLEDSMESFWLAETLKYFYLLFATPDVISLDEWVLNTEAHPFRRPT